MIYLGDEIPKFERICRDKKYRNGPRIEYYCFGCNYFLNVEHLDVPLQCELLNIQISGTFKTPENCPFLRKFKLQQINK